MVSRSRRPASRSEHCRAVHSLRRCQWVVAQGAKEADKIGTVAWIVNTLQYHSCSGDSPSRVCKEIVERLIGPLSADCLKRGRILEFTNACFGSADNIPKWWPLHGFARLIHRVTTFTTHCAQFATSRIGRRKQPRNFLDFRGHSPPLPQQFRGFCVTLDDRKMQGGFIKFGQGVGIGAMIEQQSDNLRTANSCSDMEWGLRLPPDIRVGTAFEQQSNNVS